MSRFNLVSSVFVQGSSRRCKEHPKFLQLGRDGALSERLGNPAFTGSWNNESSPWRKVPVHKPLFPTLIQKLPVPVAARSKA